MIAAIVRPQIKIVTPAEVRAARGFLRSYAKAGTTDIPPRKFAQAAKELGVGFRELLRLVAKISTSWDGKAFKIHQVRR